jgi:hypothetical protein
MTKPTPATTAQRVTKLRAARKASGLKKLELWVRPEHVEKVKAFSAELAKQTK